MEGAIVAATLNLIITQAQQYKVNLFLMCSYIQDQYFAAKFSPTPDVVEKDDQYAACHRFHCQR
jgi:hypothetical protein